MYRKYQDALQIDTIYFHYILLNSDMRRNPTAYISYRTAPEGKRVGPSNRSNYPEAKTIPARPYGSRKLSTFLRIFTENTGMK
jgi:hypothetical protein